MFIDKFYMPDGADGGNSKANDGDQPNGKDGSGNDHKKVGGDSQKSERELYLESELKKVVKDRDTYKSKVREREDADRIADEKKLEEKGEYKEIIANNGRVCGGE